MILSEEQRLLMETARSFCAEQAPIAQLRGLRDRADPDGFDRGVWQAMAGLGWPAIPWEEGHGGLAFGYLGLGLVTEATGRTLAPSPLMATVWLGGTLVNEAGNAAQKQALLPALAAGRLLLAVALEESHQHRPDVVHTTAVHTTAVRAGAGHVLNGVKTFVLDGHVADQLVVVARTAGQPGERHGLSLFLVDRSAPGVQVERLNMVDARNAARVSLVQVTVGAEALLGCLDEAADALDRTLDIARIGLAAEMLGSLQACFETTVAYLKDRVQFGVPIGSFQALKHRAAELHCEIELSISCVQAALAALDDGADAGQLARLASLAKAQVGRTFARVAREAVQMHGGNGMTDDFDIGLFLKRQAVAEQTLGGTAFHTKRYAALGGQPERATS